MTTNEKGSSLNNEMLERQLYEWRNSFINTSIKNNKMLNNNVQVTDAVILDVNQYFSYDYFWKIATGTDKDRKSEYALKHFGNTAPMSNPIYWHSAKSGKMDVELMHTMVQEGIESIVQKGENPICLMFGRLKWYVAKTSDKDLQYGEIIQKNIDGTMCSFVEIQTPLILIPVKLNERGTNFWMKPVDEDAMINPSLILKYSEEGYSPFPLPECGSWIDKDNFDIVKYFETLEKHFSNSEFEFDKNFVGINTFDYDRMCMYSDVHRHFEDIKNNKIIRAMFGERINFPKPVKGIDYIDPHDCFCVLDSNSSQSRVIERFNNDESFILEGPPGTGKTQTIVNMIAEAVNRNKSVLFVSGKMSALNTVLKKLRLMSGVNIDKHCILIKGEDEAGKTNISDVYGKLDEALNAPCPQFKAIDYERNLTALTQARDTLVGYNSEFYDAENSLNMSPYDIIGRVLKLGYNENYLIPVTFDKDFIANLTPEDVSVHTAVIADIQSILIKILGRSGSIENDVWYGYKKFDADNGDEEKLRAYCYDIRLALGSISFAAESVKMGESSLKGLTEELFKFPLCEISAVMNNEVVSDLKTVYLSGTFEEQKSLLKDELERSEKYVEAANIYSSSVCGDCPLPPEKINFLLFETDKYDSLSVADISAQLQKLSSVSESVLYLSQNGGGSGELPIKELHSIISSIKTVIESSGSSHKACGEILKLYSKDILTYDYKPLLIKFRTSWADKVKSGKDPLFFASQIKEIKKHCKDVQHADFSVTAIYSLLEQLDKIKGERNTEKENRENLKKYGLEGLSVEALASLKIMLEEYTAFREKITASYQSVDFHNYVVGRKGKFIDILDACAALKVNGNPTVGDLREVAKAYETVYLENERITHNAALNVILPSMNSGVYSDWHNMICVLDVAQKIKQAVHNVNLSFQDDFAVFAEVVQTLVSKNVLSSLNALVGKYIQFYSEEQWFENNENSHCADKLTLSDFNEWLGKIQDINNLTEYVAYKRKVKQIEGTPEGEFFARYAKEGRKNYPIENLRSNYEITLLCAYYHHIIEGMQYVCRLSGSDGVTTVKRVSDMYAAADKKALEFNRKIVDYKLYSRIERTAIGKSPLHGYLRSLTTDKNASVRRLFKQREQSIKQLAPCLMMSVYSVSKLLDYEKYKFDVVIFDEASQIPAEDALTSLMRATRQVVIAGDPKQMPAISYFGKRDTGKQQFFDPDDENAPQTCSSIIDFVINAPDNTLAYERLDMHYRSNHESLIKFSNEYPKLYGGNLVTFPSPKARNENFGLWNYSLSEDPRCIGFLRGGGGENEMEAIAVCDLIRRHFEKYPLPVTDAERENYNSLGVIVFGTKQKALILSKMRQSAELNAIAALNDNRIFSITTADEIQGDEMSEMILSLTYGRGADGKVSAAWGHMNQLPVALYKFNVAVTRAKNNLKFVHSVTSGDISGSKNLEYVADYLRQFESLPDCQFISDKSGNTDFIEAVGKICEEEVGKERVVYNFGESPRSYRVPISILSNDRQSVVLGIMCEKNRTDIVKTTVGGETAVENRGFSVREYSRTCNDILDAHGWNNLYETYAIQWLRNYAVEKVNLLQKLREVKDI